MHGLPGELLSCASESTVAATVTVTEGPALTQAVTIDKPAPCSGDVVTISVATQANSSYTYTIRNGNDISIGSSFTGTGGVVARTTTYAITDATPLMNGHFMPKYPEDALPPRHGLIPP